MHSCVFACVLISLCCIKTEPRVEAAKGLACVWNDLCRVTSGCTQRHTLTHASVHIASFFPQTHTSLSCSISLSFCSSRPSSWWMVISASASRLVRSWSSSVARDDMPLLCNISSNFFIDSSLLENNSTALNLWHNNWQQEISPSLSSVVTWQLVCVSVCLSSAPFLPQSSSGGRALWPVAHTRYGDAGSSPLSFPAGG